MTLVLEIPPIIGYLIFGISTFLDVILRYALLPIGILLNIYYFENRIKFNKLYLIYLILFTIVIGYEYYFNSHCSQRDLNERLLISYVLYVEYFFSLLVRISFFIKDNVEL